MSGVGRSHVTGSLAVAGDVRQWQTTRYRHSRQAEDDGFNSRVSLRPSLLSWEVGVHIYFHQHVPLEHGKLNIVIFDNETL